MPRKLFQISYPDGTKKNIDRIDRDDLVLSGLAKETAPSHYTFTGVPITYHTFVDWGKVAMLSPRELQRRFLPGSFIIEHDGKRKREMLETAGALAVRLRLYEGQASQ